MDGPEIPDTFTTEEINQHLDRVALEITASQNGTAILPLYSWLEWQLEKRIAREKAMISVRARVERLTRP